MEGDSDGWEPVDAKGRPLRGVPPIAAFGGFEPRGKVPPFAAFAGEGTAQAARPAPVDFFGSSDQELRKSPRDVEPEEESDLEEEDEESEEQGCWA